MCCGYGPRKGKRPKKKKKKKKKKNQKKKERKETKIWSLLLAKIKCRNQDLDYLSSFLLKIDESTFFFFISQMSSNFCNDRIFLHSAPLSFLQTIMMPCVYIIPSEYTDFLLLIKDLLQQIIWNLKLWLWLCCFWYPDMSIVCDVGCTGDWGVRDCVGEPQKPLFLIWGPLIPIPPCRNWKTKWSCFVM